MMFNPLQPERRGQRAESLGKDINPLLKGWDYEAGTISVRKIHGTDGLPKLQMRLDLGLLQMEIAGRPDGVRPHGCESLLDFHEAALQQHKSRNDMDLGFHLTGRQCHDLREEAIMYYHRYLSLFVLEDYPGVVRDTARNLRVLDLCGKYAVEEHDRIILEQYRPYLTMMNARAAASLLCKEERYPQALDTVKKGLSSIRRFYRRFGQSSEFSASNEARVLRSFARDIRRKMPVDPREKLQSRLQRAIRREDYEEAARIRDQLKELS